MIASESEKPAILDILPFLLPSEEETWLLRACLYDADGACAAWNTWVNQVGDPRAAFERDRQGLKGLLPFLEYALRRNGIDSGRSFQTYLRVAHVRESLRNKIYRDILARLLQGFDEVGIPVIALKGAALSETVYEESSGRHNHGIDLLISPEHMDRAAKRVRALDFEALGASPGDADHRMSVHSSGLPLGLHARLFFIPHYQEPIHAMWARSRPQTIAGIDASVLSPADNLIHVCGHASYSSSRGNLRWVCDAWYLIQRHPDLDWSTLIDVATQARLAPALSTMLRYLTEDLGAPVPAEVLAALDEAAKQIDTATEEAIVLSAVNETRSHLRALRRFGAKPGLKVRFLKFMFFPSPIFMQWKYQIQRAWFVPLLYAYRPLSYGLRTMVYRPLRRRFSNLKTA